MKPSTLFRKWWVILLQGILMIVLSILIFNNPDTVLSAIAFWLGAIVMVSGCIGIIAWFTNEKESRDLPVLLASLVMLIIGILMISKMFVTIKAITLVFGLLAAIVGLVLISGGWNGRKQWPLWWLIALLGVGALIIGIKSILDVNEGAENVSTLIGTAVLLSGIGMIFLAFFKKRIVQVIGENVGDIRSGINTRR
jgi:uncharacterized membrane protein HdeD (DUF308 family)